MANVSNFEINGISYSYDMESRNPLSDKVKAKAIEGGLVYDTKTKAPTEVVGVPANSLKAAEESVDNGQEGDVDNRQERTLTFYSEYSCISFPVTIVYKGSLNNTSGKPHIRGSIVDEDLGFNGDAFETSILNIDGKMYYGPYGDGDGFGKIEDDSEDEGFELVRLENQNYSPSRKTKIIINNIWF